MSTARVVGFSGVSVVAALLLMMALTVSAEVGDTTRVSVSADGSGGNGGSTFPSLSADGRHVTFESLASNLVPDDTNGAGDVFVRDTETGEMSRVSVTSDGSQASGSDPSISADGRYVAFRSGADNLADNDTNNTSDVFLHDRETGETDRVSVSSEGMEADRGALAPSISADGRHVAFNSLSTTLIDDDTNELSDVFVHDTETGETTRVSVASDGSEGDGHSSGPSISADGRFVTFLSGTTNLVAGDTNGEDDVFVHDTDTGETTRVSVASDGTQADSFSFDPVISADGEHIAFHTFAANLVEDDTNEALDVFVHDITTGETSRVSIAGDGTEADGNSSVAAISGDGSKVTFFASATNLVEGDTNNTFDVFVHDTTTGETSRVSTHSDGTEGDGFSAAAAISADGRFVAFHSSASNLVDDDSNGNTDVFVHHHSALEGKLRVEPDTLEFEVEVGDTATNQLTLANDGNATVIYGVTEHDGAPDPSFQGVGDLPGDGLFFSWAYGISGDGSTAVGRSSNGPWEPYRWEDGVMTGLGSLPGGGGQGQALGASYDGNVVVGYTDTDEAASQAFVWEDGTMTSLGHLGGDNVQSWATDASHDGSVIVGATSTPDGIEAFRWDDGTMTALGDLGGGSHSSDARGVSADGSVVAGKTAVEEGTVAFRWEDAVMENLGDLTGGSVFAEPRAISADGEVVVGYSFSENGVEAFRSMDGEMVGLGDLPGGDFRSFARDVSGDGSIVVGYSWSDAEGNTAMIWDQTEGMRELQQILVNDYGLDLTGWTLQDAEAISDDGTVIAGSGISENGNEGWVANLGDTDISWLEVDPTEVVLDPSSSESLDVSVDTTGLELGEYQAELRISSTTDGTDEVATVPVHLTVFDPATTTTVPATTTTEPPATTEPPPTSAPRITEPPSTTVPDTAQPPSTTLPAPEPGETFADVPEDHIFHGDIEWLAESGITYGCNPPDNTLFCPDDPVTRGQMAALLNRSLDLPEALDDHFVDDANLVFEDDINRLAESGITHGCNPPDNTEFCPKADVLRQEMASFLVRGYHLESATGDQFTDDDGSVHEADIEALAASGVTVGCNPPDNTLYCPMDVVIRGQMAAFLQRADRFAP